MTSGARPRRSGPCALGAATAASILLLFASFVTAQEAIPDPDPRDVESIDAVITALYAVISGDAGEDRDWDRFRSLFAPGATLSPVSSPDGSSFGRRIWTPGEYAEFVDPHFEENGFHEIEIHQETVRYGVIAHAFSTYETRRLAQDAQPVGRGINSIQLLDTGSGWRIVSIFWLSEEAGRPIPGRFLPNSSGSL